MLSELVVVGIMEDEDVIETMGDSRQGTARKYRDADAQDLEPSIPTVFKFKELIFAALSSSNINLFTYTHSDA